MLGSYFTDTLATDQWPQGVAHVPHCPCPVLSHLRHEHCPCRAHTTGRLRRHRERLCWYPWVRDPDRKPPSCTFHGALRNRAGSTELCGAREMKEEKQVRNSLKTKSLWAKCTCLHTCSKEMLPPHWEPWSICVCLAAGDASDVCTHSNSSACQFASRWDKRWGWMGNLGASWRWTGRYLQSQKERVQREILHFTVSLLQLLYLNRITTAPSPLWTGTGVLRSVQQLVKLYPSTHIALALASPRILRWDS